MVVYFEHILYNDLEHSQPNFGSIMWEELMNMRPNYLELCNKIKLPQEAVNAINNLHITEDQISTLKKLCFEDKQKFYEEVKQSNHYREIFLFLYLQFACDRYEDFKCQGFADEIYWDTFQDITIWCNTCYRDYGVYGIEEYDWIYNHVTMKLFKIGRLQYELKILCKDLIIGDKTIPKGTPAINVHIPEGTPLNEQACIQSITEAKVIFPSYDLFICHSWLLHPGLKDILPEHSNILKFQNLFFIFDTDDESTEARERIFGRHLKDISQYPENTTLQKNAKIYLQQGLPLGNGFGVCEL